MYCTDTEYVEQESVNMREKMKDCPVCNKKMSPLAILLARGGWELIHFCMHDNDIIVRGNSKDEVIRKWNAIVSVIENRKCD